MKGGCIRRLRPRTSNAPCLAKGNLYSELIAVASTSLGAAKVRAAAISIPRFADQEQENITRGLQEPQLLFETRAFYAWI